MVIFPATTTEFVHINVTNRTGADITTMPVRIAVVAHSSNPASDEWHNAAWADGHARLLIGPDGGAQTLPTGTYQVWINIDPPGGENIVRPSGQLLIT